MEISKCALVLLIPFGLVAAYFAGCLIAKGSRILKRNLDKLATRSFVFRPFRLLPVATYGCLIALITIMIISRETPQVTIVACNGKPNSSAVASSSTSTPAILLTSIEGICQYEKNSKPF